MKIAISVGDINGIGLEILLKSHKKISKICQPIYCVDEKLLKQAAKILGLKDPKDLCCVSPCSFMPCIEPACITKESGEYSYASFLKALELVKEHKVQAITTLPIHKKAWQLANVPYAGHTQALRDIFKQEVIMVLGCKKLYMALFSDHIPLREVFEKITFESLLKFLLQLAPFIHKPPCGVLGLNPHAGDFGVLGDEEEVIREAIKRANIVMGEERFIGPLVPDTAFVGKHWRYYVAMYHDQGLIPLKMLYFKNSINLTLNLPFIRTSVDHGTAFDIAYGNKADTKSYRNAIKEIIRHNLKTKGRDRI